MRPRGFELTGVSLTTNERRAEARRSAKADESSGASIAKSNVAHHPAGRANKRTSDKEVFYVYCSI